MRMQSGHDVCALVLLIEETSVPSALAALSDPSALFHLCPQVSCGPSSSENVASGPQGLFFPSPAPRSFPEFPECKFRDAWDTRPQWRPPHLPPKQEANPSLTRQECEGP